MDDKLESLLSKTGDIALRRRANWLIKNLDPKSGEKILDIGCGDGYYLYLLSNLDLDLDLELFGTDFDNNALKSAKKNLKGKKIKFAQADLMKKLPFENDSFDKIVMSEVLEHLPDPVYGLFEVKRILKKNGIIVLSVPHKNYPFLWDPVNWFFEKSLNFHIKKGFWAGIWNQHLRLYSKNELRKDILKSGFKISKIKILTHYCLPFNHHLINLVARFLAKSKSATLKKSFSKFKSENKTSAILPFSLIFGFDKLNDNWDGNGEGVSLVIKCKK